MARWTTEDVKSRPDVLEALVDLLWQMADDDFILGYRDQEWLGLAPHIEEDVAFGSIGQEEIGHAALYFRMLESLGMGSADDLASLRPAAERRNAVLLELPNGDGGDYLTDPHFDWAWTIARHYLHDVWDMARLAAVADSVYEPLADAAQKVLGEKRYHRAHQELWLRTMARNNRDAHARLQHALNQAFEWVGDLAGFGRWERTLEELGLVRDVEGAKARFWREVTALVDELELALPEVHGPLNGREGQHTEALEPALATLSEVYRLDPQAHW